MNSTDYWTVFTFQRTREKRLRKIAEAQGNKKLDIWTELQISTANLQNINADMELLERFI